MHTHALHTEKIELCIVRRFNILILDHNQRGIVRNGDLILYGYPDLVFVLTQTLASYVLLNRHFSMQIVAHMFSQVI